MQTQKIQQEIESQKDQMTQALMEIIRVPAIAPENGGQGELLKAEKLTQLLETIGFDKIERHDAEDNRVPSGKRPNITAYYSGQDTTQKLWIITHLDIVPPGEESFWTTTEPFQPIVKERRVYGRGAEDNGQSMIASIFAVKVLKSLNLRPKRTVALAFVADEEQGSIYGIQHLINKELFKKNDLILVPDGGNQDGTFVEIAEKSALWFRVRTVGKQIHASMPDKGLNAHRAGMIFALAVDKMLHDNYSAKDSHFEPPESTFEPTKKEKNVDAVNIIPGEDIIHFDCRILPSYDIEEILKDIRQLAAEYETKTGAKIEIEPLYKSVAPTPTDPNSEIVIALKQAIKSVNGKEPKIGGIGGGTCAAFFRKINIPAVVWSAIDETAHQPNEYSKTENMVNDTKIFATLML